MAPPRFRPTREQQKLLDQLGAVADELDELDKQHARRRAAVEARRNELLLDAVQTDIKVNAAAAAARIGRSAAYPILRELGYDPNTPEQKS